MERTVCSQDETESAQVWPKMREAIEMCATKLPPHILRIQKTVASKEWLQNWLDISHIALNVALNHIVKVCKILD